MVDLQFSSLSRLALLAMMTFVCSCTLSELPPVQFCESRSVLIDANFDGGNFYRCSIDQLAEIAVEIRPEDAPPINPSAWYAFRVSPKVPSDIRIRLKVIDGKVRYWPKLSVDGSNWSRIPQSQVQQNTNDTEMLITLRLEQSPVWVSAQELLQPRDYDAWMLQLSRHPELTLRTIGRSVEGRPINALGTGDKPEQVFFFGRQHPPELSGALAMQVFVDTVFSGSELAEKFRQRFGIVVVPLLNPDGVTAGHWRHNMNGVDLNRDWGPFTQPETRSVAALLDVIDEKKIAPRLMLDFHSTQRSRFYTQVSGELPGEFDFASVWLNRSKERLPNFDFLYDPRPPSGQENSKNYFFRRYQIPAITYEIGDEVDRDEIRHSSSVFAEEMMRTLLELPAITQ